MINRLQVTLLCLLLVTLGCNARFSISGGKPGGTTNPSKPDPNPAPDPDPKPEAPLPFILNCQLRFEGKTFDLGTIGLVNPVENQFVKESFTITPFTQSDDEIRLWLDFQSREVAHIKYYVFIRNNPTDPWEYWEELGHKYIPFQDGETLKVRWPVSSARLRCSVFGAT